MAGSRRTYQVSETVSVTLAENGTVSYALGEMRAPGGGRADPGSLRQTKLAPAGALGAPCGDDGAGASEPSLRRISRSRKESAKAMAATGTA